jgi:hypothetical protein
VRASCNLRIHITLVSGAPLRIVAGYIERGERIQLYVEAIKNMKKGYVRKRSRAPFKATVRNHTAASKTLKLCTVSVYYVLYSSVRTVLAAYSPKHQQHLSIIICIILLYPQSESNAHFIRRSSRPRMYSTSIDDQQLLTTT